MITPASAVRSRQTRELRFTAKGGGSYVEWCVLAGRGVQECGQLVHFQERAFGLGDPDAHPFAARVVVIDLAVFDRVVEDRRKRGDQLAQRRLPQGHDPPASWVANIGTGLDRLA